MEPMSASVENDFVIACNTEFTIIFALLFISLKQIAYLFFDFAHLFTAFSLPFLKRSVVLFLKHLYFKILSLS